MANGRERATKREQQQVNAGSEEVEKRGARVEEKAELGGGDRGLSGGARFGAWLQIDEEEDWGVRLQATRNGWPGHRRWQLDRKVRGQQRWRSEGARWVQSRGEVAVNRYLVCESRESRRWPLRSPLNSDGEKGRWWLEEETNTLLQVVGVERW
ncbi:hypothetical protein AMTR_s00027p00173850 [Amborella trichopoda]|uniref:Uncharacterized protein n=1 Tax=Amborella trichopoda TaxID=13333 RepID=W1PSE0_AMBTC|nr:hypothetical protein AMTR_s00027p00173850 [Amborella trichopoda]